MTQTWRPPLFTVRTKSIIGPYSNYDVPRTGYRLENSPDGLTSPSGSWLHDITLHGSGDCLPENLPVMIEGRPGVHDVTIGRVNLSGAVMIMDRARYWNGDLVSIEEDCEGWKIVGGLLTVAGDACIDAKSFITLGNIAASYAPRLLRLWKGGEGIGTIRLSNPYLWGGTSAPCGIWMKTGTFVVDTLKCAGFGDAPLLWGEPGPDQAPPEIIIKDRANSILPKVLVHGRGKVSFA